MKINENKKNSLKNHFNYSTSNPASLTAPAKSTSDTFSLSHMKDSAFRQLLLLFYRLPYFHL